MANDVSREALPAKAASSSRFTSSLLGGPLKRGERLTGLAMTLPALIFFVLFIGIPIVRTVLLGFQKWNAIGPAQWVGLGNYQHMLGDAVFHRALFVTFFLTTVLTVFLIVIPMLLAVLFNMGWGYFGTLGRTMMFMPSIISWVVTGALWKLILDPNLGSLNRLLENIGLASLQQNWLGDPDIVLWSIAVVAIWQQLGLYVIIFFAGIQGIDGTLYEAAEIDGANARQKFRNVTVPMLRPVTLVVLTLNLLNGIKLFDVIWVMTQGGPVNASQVLGTYMYRVSFANPGLPDFGYGSALSTVILVLCLFVLVFQLWLNKRTNI
jgi:multiple sugar transport system permease protein/raffinose/stachyose/melibiose transport system permease protein